MNQSTEVVIHQTKANQAMRNLHLAWEIQVFIQDMLGHLKKLEQDTDTNLININEKL